VALLLFTVGLLSAGAEDKFNVLLISSYHPNFPTFYQQINGIREALPVSVCNLDVEFMDSKRFPGAETRGTFKQYLLKKLRSLPDYDLILTADDNALHFVVDNKPDLFPGLPVVFLGVNDLSYALQQNSHPEITGVVETVSIRETIELACQLQPGLKTVYAICDGSLSGRADLDAFIKCRAAFAQLEFKGLNLAEISWAELSERLSAIQQDGIILLLAAYTDREGVRKTFSSSRELMLEQAQVPVFHLWEHGLGDGILGGVVVSHVQQGKVAGLMAADILRGKAIETMAVETNSPNRIVVDYKVLQKHHIALNSLPESIEVLNRPSSFYRENHEFISVIIAVFIILSGFIVVLVLNTLKRRKIEEQLQQSEQLFKALFNELLQFCALIRLDGTIVQINESALKVRKLDAGDVVGTVFWESPWWAGSGYEERVEDAVSRAARGETVRFLATVENPFRGKVAIDFSIKPILESGHRLLLAEGRDVTEMRQLQETVKNKEKMEAIGRLAGGVAHDFNNMLGGIMGLAELMDMDLPADALKQKRYARRIVSSCKRAAQLTQQLLSFARQGKQESVIVNLRQTIEDAILLLGRSVDKRVRIVSSFCDETLNVAGDPGQLESVMINLGLNARDAMPDGGILSISVRKRTIDAAFCSQSQSNLQPGDYAEVEVRDDGLGIPADLQERIFEPFFTTKDVGEGTGLGLAAVYGTIKDHRGEVTVESTLNKGTLVRLLLPLSAETRTEAQEQLPQHDVRAERKTILVVDDEPIFRTMLESVLNKLGYKTICAESGRIGVELYQQHGEQIALCIIDAIMPEMNGMQTMKVIRSINPAAKVVIASGFTAETTRSDFLTAGAEAFLAKPCSIVELSTVVYRQLEDG
jgi:PAS domain S-box-containing protein